MKKVILILIILGILNFSISANENQEKISFEKICNSLATTKYISGDFELQQINGKNNRILTSFGTYFLSAEDGIITYTTKPIKMVMAITETYVFQESNGKAKKIDGSKNNTFLSISKVVSSMFTGKYEKIVESFEIEYVANFSQNQIEWSATFFPKDKTFSSYIQKITMQGTYKNDDVCIEKFSIEKFNNDKSIYQLSNRKILKSLADSERKYFEK